MHALWTFLTSLRLTIFLLAASTLLVFFGTLDQVHDGIYLTQQRYFEHAFVVWTYPQQWLFFEYLGWIRLPMPAGYLLGPLLVINLFCAHFKYYQARWRKMGIALIHGGLVILLVGQLVTQLGQKDFFLWLDEGEKNNYIESFHDNELVVIDKSHPDFNRVVSWPVSSFSRQQTTLRHPSLPFMVDVAGFVPNAAILPRDQAPADAPDLGFTQGLGADRDFTVLRMSPTYADGERNRATAIVDLRSSEGTIGRWLVSNVFRDKTPTQVVMPPQEFEFNGRTFEIALRFTREYLPAHIKLNEFTHDRYPGTDIPHNFSSDIDIIDTETGTTRSTLIYMNNPLRFAGYTFYQASFANNDTSSMFQVVRNPGRWIPYIATVVITLGLALQFGIGLLRFAGRGRNRSRNSQPSSQQTAPAQENQA